jgi:hypothetical protein
MTLTAVRAKEENALLPRSVRTTMAWSQKAFPVEILPRRFVVIALVLLKIMRRKRKQNLPLVREYGHSFS